MTSEATMLMTTVADAAGAEKIASALLERGQAACVQQLDILSRYRWEGELRSDPEILLLVKTSVAARDAAIETIRSLHDYDLPEIAAVPITAGLPGYLDWVVTETSRGATD